MAGVTQGSVTSYISAYVAGVTQGSVTSYISAYVAGVTLGSVTSYISAYVAGVTLGSVTSYISTEGKGGLQIPRLNAAELQIRLSGKEFSNSLIRYKKEKGRDYFTTALMGLRLPLMLVRKALAEPNFRNMSRRTGIWLSSSVT